MMQGTTLAQRKNERKAFTDLGNEAILYGASENTSLRSSETVEPYTLQGVCQLDTL